MEASNSLGNSRVSVVIPTLNAAGTLPGLLDRLDSQYPLPPHEIILVDSMSSDATLDIARGRKNVRTAPIRDFSHGRARNMGVREARGEIVVFLTQDALPADNHWLERLKEPLNEPGVAAVYSRQEPRPDAPPTEKFFLAYHFPAGVRLKRSLSGIARAADIGLQDVFFSNVSSAARRKILMRHPFDETLIMSEDQQFAREVIQAGYAVVYQPDSVVIHSHRYSLGTAFRRYFDSIYSITTIFPNHGLKSSAAMGRRYLRLELGYMLRRHPWYLPYYFLYTLAKTAGAVCGHFAGSMPEGLARACSLHNYYWKSQAKQK